MKQNDYRISKYYGNIPSTREELLKIPGVGDYVAGVILAVSFSKKAPIVDSNIARVLNRYLGMDLEGDIRRNKKIVEKVNELFSYCNCEPKELLFAIIDFSDLVCTPLNPRHEICPFKDECRLYIKN
ncbi:MAG: hypothetical protein ABII27_04780 [bacterium]